jgi:hypothetical protein
MTSPLLYATQTITIPYHFEVIDFSSSTAPDLPTIDLGSIDFVNLAGSIAVTLYKMLEDYAFIGYFVLILVALAVIFWIWTFVTDRPGLASINLSGAIDAGADVYSGSQNYRLEQENDAIEGSGALDRDSNRAGLGRATISLNKSLMKQNNDDANLIRSAGRLRKRSSKLKW